VLRKRGGINALKKAEGGGKGEEDRFVNKHPERGVRRKKRKVIVKVRKGGGWNL